MVNKNQAVIGVIGALIVIAVVVAATMYFSVKISGTGSIKAVGCKIYADEAMTKEISAVDWGVIPVGGTSDVTFFVKSTSTVPVTLTITKDNYNPASFATYSTLSWTYNNAPLQPNELRAIDLTLKVSQSIVGITTFSFDMTITASG